MSKCLEIQLGSNYQIIVETDKEKIINSPFISVYSKAFELLKEIEDFNVNFVQQQSLRENKDDLFEVPYTYNNIIAFTGDRGIGKTSSMLSFSNMLKMGGAIDPDGNYKETSKKYYITKVVDPALFNQNSNILEVVISHLFSQMIQELKKENSNNENDKKETLEAFERVFKNIKTTLKKKEDIYSGDSVEALIALADASDMHKNISCLFKKFLKFVNKESLVIQIDDIDLHTQHAHEMAEMIRKYLTHPNVIVLIALNPDQLEDVIFQQFLKEYKGIIDTLSNQKTERDGKIADARSMTSRYMEKFLPIDRRVYLPSLYELNSNASIRLLKKAKNGIGYEIYCERKRIDELFMELFYVKSEVITYESKKSTYYLMPKNLREAIYLLEKLISMKTVAFTSFVHSIRILQCLDNGYVKSNYNKLINEDGIARYIDESDKIDNEINALIDQKSQFVQLVGLLKLRTSKENYFNDDFENVFKAVEFMKFEIQEINDINISNLKDRFKSLFDLNKMNIFKDYVKYPLKSIDEYSNIKVIKEIQNKSKKLQITQLVQHYTQWCKNNLKLDETQLISHIFDTSYDSKNKFVVNFISEKISEKLNLEPYTDSNEDSSASVEDEEILSLIDIKEFLRIKNMGNNSKNISFGDLSYLLDIYRQCFMEESDAIFIYAIRLSYNYILQEIDTITEDNEHERSSLYKFVFGGSVYNPVGKKVITSRPVQKGDFLNRTRNIILLKNDKKWILNTLSTEPLEVFKMLIKDFTPSTKIRMFYKTSSDENSLEKYMGYRLLDDVYYEYKEEMENVRIVLLDIWGFMFNLMRLGDYDENFWMYNNRIDFYEDYKQLNNVFIYSRLIEISNILKRKNFVPWHSNVSKKLGEKVTDEMRMYDILIYYANYLKKMKELTETHELSNKDISLNSFMHLNYLKVFTEDFIKVLKEKFEELIFKKSELLRLEVFVKTFDMNVVSDVASLVENDKRMFKAISGNIYKIAEKSVIKNNNVTLTDIISNTDGTVYLGIISNWINQLASAGSILKLEGLEALYNNLKLIINSDKYKNDLENRKTIDSDLVKYIKLVLEEYKDDEQPSDV